MTKTLPSLPARFVSQSGRSTVEFDAAPLLLALPAKEFNRVRRDLRKRHFHLTDLDALVLSSRAGIDSPALVRSGWNSMRMVTAIG
jgi:hypothetical protein